MSNNTDNIPRIKKVSEIGDVPFQVVQVVEKILQGWDKEKRKSIYLFKSTTGSWSYYDKKRKSIVKVSQWRGKEANIDGDWVLMSAYRRVHLVFAKKVIYTDFTNKKGGEKIETFEGMINLTESAYEALLKQQEGRPADSLYRFTYKKGGSGQYIDGATWADPFSV